MVHVEDSARPRLARGVRMRFDQARGQHVLLSPESVSVLNATGAAIVELCDGVRTVADIQTELQGRYAEVRDGDVQRFIAALVEGRGMRIDHG